MVVEQDAQRQGNEPKPPDRLVRESPFEISQPAFEPRRFRSAQLEPEPQSRFEGLLKIDASRGGVVLQPLGQRHV